MKRPPENVLPSLVTEKASLLFTSFRFGIIPDRTGLAMRLDFPERDCAPSVIDFGYAG
jgi:hypothetical protein